MDQRDSGPAELSGIELRPIEVRIGPLGWSSLVEEAGLRRTTEAALVAAACEHLADLPENGIAHDVPRFGGRGDALTAGEQHRIALSLSAASWNRLERDAARRGIGLESLVRHAILVYLARSV